MVHVEQIRAMGWLKFYLFYIFSPSKRANLEAEAFIRETDSELIAAYEKEKAV
jgi:hypothetical protein